MSRAATISPRALLLAFARKTWRQPLSVGEHSVSVPETWWTGDGVAHRLERSNARRSAQLPA
jgi:hypothetical protein